MQCKNCGYELPKTRTEETCQVCRKIKLWNDKVSLEIFSRRIARVLQVLTVPIRRKDINLLVAGRGLFLYGDPGTGKTIYACALAFEFLRRCFAFPDYPYLTSFKFTSVSDLLEEIRASFNTKIKEEEKQKTTKEILDYYGTVDVLILDDLGTSYPTEWSLQILQMIINNRYEKLLSTIITSNLGLEALSEQLDDRISSRIYEMCLVRNLGTQDYRLQKD